MSASFGRDQEIKEMWEYFMGVIRNEYGVAGLMGNLNVESLLKSDNLENAYEREIGMNDAEYTQAVDEGRYTKFATDHAGYGLAQWTVADRKGPLLEYAKELGVSVGDYMMQCKFLVKELENRFSVVLNDLVNAKSIREASDSVCKKFERPANQSESALQNRANFGQRIYDKCHVEEKKEEPKVEEPFDGKCYASRVIAVAEGEVGYHEKATNADLDDPTANSGYGNWNKYARDIDSKYPNWYNGKKNGYDWCDIFVDWNFITAYGYENALRLTCQPEKSFGAGCRSSLRYYRQQNRFFTSDPQPGDQIFFGSDPTEVYHTGLVVEVKDGNVITVEGNNKDAVIRCTYSVTNRNICGYGRPAYDVKVEQDVVTDKDKDEPVKKDEETVYVVKLGDTLGKIAAQYNVTVAELAKFNEIANPNLILVGQKIRIPGTKKSDLVDQKPVETKPDDGKFEIGDAVVLDKNAKWWNGYDVPNWVVNRTMYIKQNHRYPMVAIGPDKNGEDVTGRIDVKYLRKT